MGETFFVKWNEAVNRDFSRLWDEKEFHDVTLVSDDLQEVSAHKVVLSSCSEYFSSILKKSKYPSPYLCLEGTTAEDIKNVLQFIYHGQIELDQLHLNGFLKLAERLRLEGLNSEDKENPPPVAKSAPRIGKQEGKEPAIVQEEKFKPIKKESKNKSKETVRLVHQRIKKEEQNDLRFEEPKEIIEQRLEGEETEKIEKFESVEEQMVEELQEPETSDREVKAFIEEIEKKTESYEEEEGVEVLGQSFLWENDIVDEINAHLNDNDKLLVETDEAEVVETNPKKKSKRKSKDTQSQSPNKKTKRQSNGPKVSKNSKKKSKKQDQDSSFVEELTSQLEENGRHLKSMETNVFSFTTDAEQSYGSNTSETSEGRLFDELDSTVSDVDTSTEDETIPSTEKKTRRKMKPRNVIIGEILSDELKITDEAVIEIKVNQYWERVEGTKQYICKICHKEFKNTGHIKEHVESHMGDIAFPCRVCGSIQNTRCLRRMHERQIHGGRGDL